MKKLVEFSQALVGLVLLAGLVLALAVAFKAANNSGMAGAPAATNPVQGYPPPQGTAPGPQATVPTSVIIEVQPGTSTPVLPYPPPTEVQPVTQAPELLPVTQVPELLPTLTPVVSPPFPETPPLPAGKAATLHNGNIWLVAPGRGPETLMDFGDVTAIFGWNRDGTLRNC